MHSPPWPRWPTPPGWRPSASWRAGADGRVAGDIASSLEVPAATLSFHLKELASAGLVVAEQEGRYMRYRANFARMSALLGYLTENCCGGVVDCAPAMACTPRR